MIVAWLAFLFRQKYQETQNNAGENTTNNTTQLSHTNTSPSTTWSVTQEEKQSPVVHNESIKKTITDNTKRYNLEKLDIAQIKTLFQESAIVGNADTALVLEHLYKTTQQEKILKTLIEVLVAEYRFDQAYSYLQSYEHNNYKIVDPHTALYVLMNSELIQVGKESNKDLLLRQINYFHQFGHISSDDKAFYSSLLALYDNNLEQFASLVDSITDPKYAQFKADTTKSITMGQHSSDLPVYYTRGLLALDVMQYGYFKLAQQISVAILLENDGYDLPYQILAYSHFVMNNWDRAIEYLQILLEQETLTYQENYKLLAGIAHYRKGQHKQAILFLSQMPKNHPFFIDILRYQIAAYTAMGDVKNMMQSYQQLLGQSAMTALDYYSFFEKVLYEPLVSGSGYTAAWVNEYLIKQYTATCWQRLATKDQHICEYGQAGLLLYQKDTKAATELLQKLRYTIEKSYVFSALWDYYHRDGQIKKAQEMYTKAVALAVDEGLKNSTQKKLVELLQIQPIQ